MKKTALIILALCAAVLLCAANPASASAYASTSAKAAVVMEVSGGRVLFARNSTMPLPIASTTKIVTALVVIENCDIDAAVTIPKKAVGVEGSSIYLVEGEKLTVKELLYGLMLRSGNDAAVALALHCCGTLENFALMMNETAARLGCGNCNFTNPHGLHDENHYCSALDLAKISAHAMKNETFREIAGTKTVKISNEKQNYPRVLVNKNRLLNSMENATGIKTGFTKKAGRCFVGSCECDGMQLVAVLLNCGPMFEDCKSLLEHCESAYALQDLTARIEIPSTLPVEDGRKDVVGIKRESDFSYPLAKNGSEDGSIRIEVQLREYVQAPVKAGDEVGTVEIFKDDRLIFSTKIVSITNVGKKGFFDFFFPPEAV